MRLKKGTLIAFIFALALSACSSSGNKKQDISGKDALVKRNVALIEGEENAVLTDPPAVPPAVTRKYATKVMVEMETQEVNMPLNGDVEFNFWTFGGMNRFLNSPLSIPACTCIIAQRLLLECTFRMVCTA